MSLHINQSLVDRLRDCKHSCFPIMRDGGASWKCSSVECWYYPSHSFEGTRLRKVAVILRHFRASVVPSFQPFAKQTKKKINVCSMHKHGTNHREKCLVKWKKVNPLGYPRWAYGRVRAATTSAPKARVAAHTENSPRQAVPVCCFDRNTTESWPKYSQQRRPTKGGSTTKKKKGRNPNVSSVSYPFLPELMRLYICQQKFAKCCGKSVISLDAGCMFTWNHYPWWCAAFPAASCRDRTRTLVLFSHTREKLSCGISVAPVGQAILRKLRIGKWHVTWRRTSTFSLFLSFFWHALLRRILIFLFFETR